MKTLMYLNLKQLIQREAKKVLSVPFVLQLTLGKIPPLFYFTLDGVFFVAGPLLLKSLIYEAHVPEER